MTHPRSDAEILAAHPPEAVEAEVRRRYARASHQRRRRRLQAAAPVLVAAVATMMVLAGPPDTPAGPAERAKGPVATLVVHRSTPEGAELLQSGAIAKDGDVVRLTYRASAQLYGVIASLDGRGQVMLHLPEAPGVAPPLKPRDPVSLEHPYKLDDAPGFEEFHLITSDSPFSTEVVAEALRTSASLPQELTVSRFRLVKEGR